MSYVQFLKQLRRIGTQLVVFGICLMVMFFCLYFATSGVLSPVALACLGPSGILIIAGIAVYPTASEE